VEASTTREKSQALPEAGEAAQTLLPTVSVLALPADRSPDSALSTACLIPAGATR
jgi:hypothetical protein